MRQTAADHGEKKNGLRKGGRSISANAVQGLTIDNHRLPVTIIIAVVIAMFLDHDGLVAIPAATLADDFTIAIPITITAGTDGHPGPGRADADSDFFGASGHRDTNGSSSRGHHCKTLDHCMLLSL
jgi:hypothetical protein